MTTSSGRVLSEQHRAELIDLVTCLAQDESDTALLYLPLVTAARSTASRLAFAGVVRDELRHAHAFARLAEELGGAAARATLDAGLAPSDAVRPRSRIHRTALEEEIDGRVLLLLLDRAAGHRLADVAETCEWAPLVATLQDMAHEELSHVLLGASTIRRDAVRPATRSHVQAAIDRWLVPVAATFGAADDARAERWRAAGLLSRTPDDLRTGFLDEVGELASSWRLTLPRWTAPWQDDPSRAEAYRMMGG